MNVLDYGDNIDNKWTEIVKCHSCDSILEVRASDFTAVARGKNSSSPNIYFFRNGDGFADPNAPTRFMSNCKACGVRFFFDDIPEHIQALIQYMTMNRVRETTSK